MALQTLDWFIVLAFFAITLLIGLWASRTAGRSFGDFFLSGRNMPWWLLGVSMVATTFSADTPNLVTDIVRQNGVSGNWAWWAFLLTGMLTVFVYARLWRRSGVQTDLEFYELRYSGKAAAFLRGFRAIYLGVFFNVVIMASVCLAAIKIGSAMLGLNAYESVLIVSVITVIYSSLGGLKGVLLTDFFQFAMAMTGSIWAAVVVVNLPGVESLPRLLQHPEVTDKLNFFPDPADTGAMVTLLIIPLAVQWWSVWYPGAEPGGGGYIAQRMLAARNERGATLATLLFNIAHYALRPWPWLLVALASLVIFPMRLAPQPGELAITDTAREFLATESGEKELSTLNEGLAYWEANAPEPKTVEGIRRLKRLKDEYPRHPEILSLAWIYAEANKGRNTLSNPLHAEKLVYLHLANPRLGYDKLGQDVAYPSMLQFLPKGLIGLVLASLIAAVMSTLSTHLNWGASYFVNDFYHRFWRPEARDSELVTVGRLATLGLMILGAGLALLLGSALEAFQILLQIGAGTGLIFILRWFWWRINAWSEIAAMGFSFLMALYLQIIHPWVFEPLDASLQLVLQVFVTTAVWMGVTFMTRPTSPEKLSSFYQLVRPGGPGWSGFLKTAELKTTGDPGWDLPAQLLNMLLGTILIYSGLFFTGSLLYGRSLQAIILGALCLVVGILLWQRIGNKSTKN